VAELPDQVHDATMTGAAARAIITHLTLNEVEETMQHFNSTSRIRGKIHCKKLGTNGLTSGSAVPLPPVGTRTSADFPADYCTSGRPARALRVSTDIMVDPTIGKIPYGPWIIVAEQLICEQPVKP
jgi:hypothetical protein